MSQNDKQNKENEIAPIIITHEKNDSRKSIANNEDEMQRLVAYMNQFEKENISNAVVNNQHASLMLKNSHHQQQQQQLQHSSAQDKESIGNSIGDLPSIEEPSKLRLSSSSLSSYGDSLSNENNFEEASTTGNSLEVTDKTNKNSESTATIKISPNELNPMIVTTQNLNSLLSCSSTSKSHEIDRRTYIVNKMYDNLDNIVENDNSQDKCESIDDNAMNDDDQYEKVILRHKEKNESENEEKPIENIQARQR